MKGAPAAPSGFPLVSRQHANSQRSNAQPQQSLNSNAKSACGAARTPLSATAVLQPTVGFRGIPLVPGPARSKSAAPKATTSSSSSTFGATRSAAAGAELARAPAASPLMQRSASSLADTTTSCSAAAGQRVGKGSTQSSQPAGDVDVANRMTVNRSQSGASHADKARAAGGAELRGVTFPIASGPLHHPTAAVAPAAHVMETKDANADASVYNGINSSSSSNGGSVSGARQQQAAGVRTQPPATAAIAAAPSVNGTAIPVVASAAGLGGASRRQRSSSALPFQQPRFPSAAMAAAATGCDEGDCDDDRAESSPSLSADPVVGLGAAKAALLEACLLPTLLPSCLLTGVRAVPTAILLYGPPGERLAAVMR